MFPIYMQWYIEHVQIFYHAPYISVTNRKRVNTICKREIKLLPQKELIYGTYIGMFYCHFGDPPDKHRLPILYHQQSGWQFEYVPQMEFQQLTHLKGNNKTTTYISTIKQYICIIKWYWKICLKNKCFPQHIIQKNST